MSIITVAFHPTLHQILFGGVEQKIKSVDLSEAETEPQEIGTTNEWI